MTVYKGDRKGIVCPHCGSRVVTRTSWALSELARESIHACLNAACGHTFASITEVYRTISPPAIHRPGVELKVSSRTQVKHAAERLGMAPSHDETPAKPGQE